MALPNNCEPAYLKVLTISDQLMYKNENFFMVNLKSKVGKITRETTVLSGRFPFCIDACIVLLYTRISSVHCLFIKTARGMAFFIIF